MIVRDCEGLRRSRLLSRRLREPERIAASHSSFLSHHLFFFFFSLFLPALQRSGAISFNLIGQLLNQHQITQVKGRFPIMPRGRPSSSSSSCSISNFTPKVGEKDTQRAIQRAFGVWQSVTPLSFQVSPALPSLPRPSP